MGIRKYIKKYKNYETKELARRAAKKQKIAASRKIADKRFPVKKAKRLRPTARGITKAINNPYGVKFPKAKKSLIKVKKKGSCNL